MPIDPAFLRPAGALEGPLFDGFVRRISLATREYAPGERIGPFAVERELGRGGMAVVYLGRRADGEFEQQVALKLVRADAQDGVAEELFRHERQVLANLAHPHIGRLLDGGRTPEGALWFAMEFIEGEPIDAWCARRRLSLPARVDLFLDVCEAVQFAHARLLIHRDIKPSNILVTPQGSARLLDFGIAKLMTQEGDGLAAGAHTPRYASPEQVAGRQVGIASDIWQLGRLLSVMIAPDPALDPDLTEPMGARPPPGRRAASPERVVDPDLAAIMRVAMDEDPDSRYPTVADLAADVRAWLRGDAVVARGGGALYRMRKALQRHWLAATVGTLAVLTFLALTVGFILRLSQERDRAASAAERAGIEARRAQDTVEYVQSLIRGASPAYNQGQAMTVRELLDQASARLDRALAQDPQSRLAMLETIADRYHSLGELDRALRTLVRLVDATRADPRSTPAQLARRLQQLAQVEAQLDAFGDAERHLDEALALARPLGDEAALVAQLLTLRVQVLAAAGQPVRALEAARSGVARLRELRAPPLALSAGLLQLALASSAAGVHEEAIAAANEAEERQRGEVAQLTAEAAQLLADRGRILLAANRIEAAVADLVEAEARMTRLWGADDWRLAAPLADRAGIALVRGDAPAAASLLTRARALCPANWCPRRQLAVEVLRRSAEAELALGQPRAARAWLDVGQAMQQRRLPAGDLELARLWQLQSQVEAAEGNDAAAAAASQRAEALRAGLLVPVTPAADALRLP